MAQKYLVRLGHEHSSYELRRDDGRTLLRREGEDDAAWREVELERIGDSGLYLLMLDNHPVELYLHRRRGGAMVTIGRHAFDFDVGPWRPPSDRVREGAAPGGSVRVSAPMTGSIVEVRCSPGDAVAAGDVLLVIESMKMNNEVRSPAAGTVETVSITAGQRVKAGEVLVALHA